MSRNVLAAGTVCWRRVPTGDGGSTVMVLLIHRTKQRDVSFPKGKLDPGESMPQAAARETLEETGLDIALGANLGTVHYQLPGGGEKTVQYWAAEVDEATVHASTFLPNREVEAIEWVPLSRARKRLSYAADRDILDVFRQLVERDAAETFSVILLRHAKAEPRSERYPEDRLRPLSDAGEDQAELLVATLAAFQPARVLSSTAERCLRTVAPIAKHLGKKVKAREGLSQDAWDAGETFELRRILGKVVLKGKSTIVCTHRPVLPDAVRELALATSSLPGDYLRRAAELPPGGFSVLHFSRHHPGAGVLGVETYPLKV
ncbi:NUDIX domain-containing protein [Leucobacter sp. gxy201]|uniref:NUDIX hydrolase n=1 Tax=Leucobacter sp. gxy201 TaxID=2957200 RepID=UPI003DA19FD4